MSNQQNELTAVLLIAHGSRRSEANDDLVRLAELVRQRTSYSIVEIGYLELTEPTIPQGVRNCVERGAKCVLMLPFFLSAGAHVGEDIQEYRCEFSREFPGVSFQLCPPLGLHRSVVDAVLDRLEQHMGDG